MLNDYRVTGTIAGLMLGRDNDQLLAYQVAIPVSREIVSRRPESAIVLTFGEIARYYELIRPHWASKPVVELVQIAPEPEAPPQEDFDTREAARLGLTVDEYREWRRAEMAKWTWWKEKIG